MEVEAGASVPESNPLWSGDLKNKISRVCGDWRLENGSRGWSERAQPTPDV
jgi:hypothetical protein